jgi:hypothetical protein
MMASSDIGDDREGDRSAEIRGHLGEVTAPLRAARGRRRSH